MAYVLLLRSQVTTNRQVVTGFADIIYVNQQLDSFLPPDVKKFRVEAYYRTWSSDPGLSFNRSLSIRISLTSTNVVDQTGISISNLAMCNTKTLTMRQAQTTQFGQSGCVIQRPTGISTIRVQILNDGTLAPDTAALAYCLHLYFYPIDD